MQHLAIIPDGNRRWALKNKLQTFLGHKAGLEAIRASIKFSIKNNIKHLSFYIFSLENFTREEQEKRYLFEELFSKQLTKELPSLIKENIRVRFIGDRSIFPEVVNITVKNAEEATKDCTQLNLNLLFCYGGQQEIVHATKKLAQQVKDGTLNISEITTDLFAKSLWTADIPAPDLIIRTSGLTRISNFLLYQAAYSEFLFLEELWPDVTEDILKKCLEKFTTIQRNFGK
ncbi:MAG: polyprenyl diphosphate synthase [bacterium]